MEGKVKKFIEILGIELEDLEHDIEFTENLMTERREHQEITEYVFMENLAILKSEILAIGQVRNLLREAPVHYSEPAAVKRELEEIFSKRVKELGLPESTMHFLKRKLEKVERYMLLQD